MHRINSVLCMIQSLPQPKSMTQPPDFSNETLSLFLMNSWKEDLFLMWKNTEHKTSNIFIRQNLHSLASPSWKLLSRLLFIRGLKEKAKSYSGISVAPVQQRPVPCLWLFVLTYDSSEIHK